VYTVFKNRALLLLLLTYMCALSARAVFAKFDRGGVTHAGGRWNKKIALFLSLSLFKEEEEEENKTDACSLSLCVCVSVCARVRFIPRPLSFLSRARVISLYLVRRERDVK
jgi:hypothetical protein